MSTKDFIRYRNIWLAFAMFWIILFHFPDFNNRLVNSIHLIGYGGVDICFFASGIGCFYSLSADSDIGRFIKRRLKRIMPTYLIFLVFWLMYMHTLGTFSMKMALGNILGVQYLTRLGNQFNWYISAILLFYLLAPYFKIIIDRCTYLKKFFFFLFLLILSIPFWEVITYIIIVTRLPIFFLGMFVGSECKNGRKITSSYFLLSIVFLTIGSASLLISYKYLRDYLWTYGLHWYPFIFITPALCLWISGIACFFEKSKPTKAIINVLSVIGDYSFEIYLVHIPLISIFQELKSKIAILSNKFLLSLTGLLTLVLCCFLLRKLTHLIKKLITKAEC